MAFAVPFTGRCAKMHHVSRLATPVLPKLQHGKAVHRQILTPTPPAAVANDQETIAPESMWSRTIQFMTSQAPKFVAALMLAAVLVRICHSDCSSAPDHLHSR